MFYPLLKKWKPEIFQGRGKKGNYFEGWYYKCISRDERSGYAVIPGFSLGNADRHAFIHIYDGKNDRYRYHRYDLADTWCSESEFDVRIGASRFTLNEISLQIQSGEQNVSGTLRFSPIHPWPVRLFSPGAMGWYAFVPRMEDYHGVLSFNHSIEGGLAVDGETVGFTGGRGYLEKDWGVSFPQSWVWFQSNHFSDPDVSVIVSLAKIPWMGSWFTGFIIGVLFRGRLYSFSTYSGGRITELSRTGPDHIALTAVNRKYILRTGAVKTGGHKLFAPVAGEMTGNVHESLNSRVLVTLEERKTGTVLFSGEGTSAGVEFHGSIEELRDDLHLGE